MAQLKVTIGTVIGAKDVTDAKAATIADLYYKAVVLPNWPSDTPLPTTQKERLQAVVDALGRHLVDVARDYRKRELRAQNQLAESTEVAGIDL